MLEEVYYKVVILGNGGGPLTIPPPLVGSYSVPGKNSSTRRCPLSMVEMNSLPIIDEFYHGKGVLQFNKNRSVLENTY